MGGTEPATLNKAATLTLGGLTLGSIPFKTVGYNAASHAFGDGLFGANILRKYVVTLDFEKGTMTLARGKDAAAPQPTQGRQATGIPLHQYGGDLFLPLKAGNQSCWALFDTGAIENVISIRLAKTLSIDVRDVRSGTVNGRFGIGKNATSAEIFLSPVQVRISLDERHRETGFLQNGLDGFSFVDKQLSSNCDFEIGMMLGAPLVTLYPRVTLDYPHHLLTVEYVPFADTSVSGK